MLPAYSHRKENSYPGLPLKRLDICRELLSITERIRDMAVSQEFDRLAALLEERQTLITKIQNFDAEFHDKSGEPDSKERKESLEILERMKKADRDARLRVACELSDLTEELKKIKDRKTAIKHYRAALSG